MNLYIIRHGQAEHNVKKILDENPRNNTNLTKKGIIQVQKKAQRLSKNPLDIIFSSQYPRSIQTASIINQFHHVKIKIDKRLNERKTGLDKQPVRRWKNLSKKDKFSMKLQGGESFQEEKARLRSFLSDLRKKPYKNILLATHGEPMQIINGLLKKLSDHEIVKRKIRNTQCIAFKIKHL